MSSITKEDVLLREGYKIFATQLSFDAYTLLFKGERIYSSFKISALVTVAGTGLSLLATSMLAFAVSSKNLKFRQHISFFVFFTMLFNGGIIPFYILVTQYLKLGNTVWALILPYMINPWFMFLMRNFFSSIPDSILESAKIDGASDIFLLFRMVMPLSLPALATVSLFYALQYWNDWWLSLLFIERRELFPLQFLLRALVSNLMGAAGSLNSNITVQLPSHAVRMATTVVTIGPIIFSYPMVQRYFIKGLTVGSVKG